jgi:sodium/potassium-transporting ATPase subunit alpha
VLESQGAPDVLLTRCTKSLDPSGGAPIDLTPEVVSRLTRTQENWATKGMRVLLLARRAIPRSEVPKELAFDSQSFADHVNSQLNQDLTVVGLVGLVDPPKVDTEETVTTLRGAYIRFMMVTVSDACRRLEVFHLD